MVVRDTPAGPDWDRRYRQLLVITPWLLLVPAAVLSQLPTDQTTADRAVTLGLVAATAGWVYFGHTRAPERRRGETVPGLVYFAGLIALCVALMTRDPVFFLFTITGFFHAYELRPMPLGVVGVLATSVAINGITIGLQDRSIPAIGSLVGIIVVQTAAISAGLVFTDRAAAQQRQREAMVAKLEAALEENAGLHAQLLAQAREAGMLDERQRMAREIHDTLAQGLTGIITQLQAAARIWGSPEDRARAHIDRALGLAKDSLAEARRSVQALRPGELEDARLPDALADLTRRWADGSGVDTHVEVTGDRVPLSPAIEVALFRVAQEALTNVAKHAGAARVGLTLSYLGDVVLLDIRDDGRGMGAVNGKGNGDGKGFGLNSMRQRIRSVGGSVEIESAPGEGTAVSASVPAIVVAGQ